MSRVLIEHIRHLQARLRKAEQERDEAREELARIRSVSVSGAEDKNPPTRLSRTPN